MEIFCTNTTRGLVPNYDNDYTEKQKLKLGEVYKCKIVKSRNYEFHKKFFALLQCSWEYLDASTQSHFGNNIEFYRKSLLLTLGYTNPVINVKSGEINLQVKSMSFEKMDAFEFQELYTNTRDLILEHIIKHITIEEFERNLINF